jgi:replication-associated recombination protein RarA
MKEIRTIRGYRLSEVASALQKTIRRGDARLAGYFAIEMFESNFREYLWRRLLTISAEDCWGVITGEIEALYRSWGNINRVKKGGGRIFASKAVILLCQARKCRDADHLTNLVYDPRRIDERQLMADLEEARKTPEPIPDYAFDCHTQVGRSRGKTKAGFFRDEFNALNPRQPGLFDDDLKSQGEPSSLPLTAQENDNNAP